MGGKVRIGNSAGRGTFSVGVETVSNYPGSGANNGNIGLLAPGWPNSYFTYDSSGKQIIFSKSGKYCISFYGYMNLTMSWGSDASSLLKLFCGGGEFRQIGRGFSGFTILGTSNDYILSRYLKVGDSVLSGTVGNLSATADAVFDCRFYTEVPEVTITAGQALYLNYSHFNGSNEPVGLSGTIKINPLTE
jgi:hypothetical protein